MAEIPQFYFDATSDVQGDDFDLAATAIIPGSVIQRGLEMVIEGETGRIPVAGRQDIEVREVPTLQLTVVPLLLEATEDARGPSPTTDSALIAFADSMAADPHGYRLLRILADQLPVAALQVTAHAQVVAEVPDFSSIRRVLSHAHRSVQAIRALEGGGGHWMGLGRLQGGGGGIGGIAVQGGWTSASAPEDWLIAHELGHNFGLGHAPGGPNPDRLYPYRDGSIGNEGVVKGFFFRLGRLLDSSNIDLMSYVGIHAISDYHFTKALEYRVQAEGHTAASRDPVRSLLLWGGADSTGTPHLEPAFVVDAPPLLPDARGPWTIEGRDAGAAVLFSLAFDMPEIADAGEGAGSFAYTLPVRPGWEALASVTLSGPGGAAILDGSTDRPMSIYRDGDGMVRAILQGDPVQADGAASGSLADVALDVVTSRGIPFPVAWRR